jgi:hypothetical protein
MAISMAASHYSNSNYKAYQTSDYIKKEKKSKEWEELTEEYKFAKSVGFLSPRTLRLLTEYTKTDLINVVKEWNATDEQKEALHQAGLDRVKLSWDKFNRTDADVVKQLYIKGIEKYVIEHKRLV